MSALLETELNGRRVLVVGATRNEDHGAALSVLDADDPAGTAPANREYYRCLNCPRPSPLAYLALPRADLGRLAGTRSSVSEIRSHSAGLMALVEYPASLGQACPGGAAWYHLGQKLELTRAEFVDGDAACHALQEAEGRIDHAFGAIDQADIQALRSWRRGLLSTARP